MKTEMKVGQEPEGGRKERDLFPTGRKVGKEVGNDSRLQMRQYLYFCTSKCVSICTLVLVIPTYLGVGVP